MKRFALALLFAIAATPAFAVCPSPITGKDATGTPQNLATVVDNNGNCQGVTALGDGSATGNKMTVDAQGNAHTTVTYFNNVATSAFTRQANTTAYTAGTSVCSASTCTALTVSLATANNGKGLITRATLFKSGATLGSGFSLWLYSAAPTLTTPTQTDGLAYSGPRLADAPNFIGTVNCNSGIPTSDTAPGVWYECQLGNPSTGGAIPFKTVSGATQLNGLITANNGYTPVSGEVFTFYLSGWY